RAPPDPPPLSLHDALPISRLLREAWASARVQHPGIATFYEAGEVGGVEFIAMEYVPGRTLRDRLREGPLPIDQALALVAGVLERSEEHTSELQSRGHLVCR